MRMFQHFFCKTNLIRIVHQRNISWSPIYSFNTWQQQRSFTYHNCANQQNLHNFSHFSQQQQLIIGYNFPLIKRSLSTSIVLRNSEKDVNNDMVKITDTKDTAVQVKEPLWKRFVAEMKHYFHGFKLLLFDMRVALRYCWKLIRGESLTRRERKQLVRTVADIMRLVPFLFFIIIPFMEFLLPLYLKFMPFMLPSTFKEDKVEKEKLRIRLKAKLEMAKFLQETLNEADVKKTKGIASLSEFRDFMQKIRDSGTLASTDDIVRFSRLFEDELTLDNLTLSQLQALCRLLDLRPFGNSAMLRFHLQMRLRQLEADDRTIRAEGIPALAVYELQAACRERGMRALGLSKERLQNQLNQWLELHLDRQVPITLLLLSRIMYMTEGLSTEGQLVETMLNLPKAAVAEVELKAAETLAERVDNRAKLERLRKEEAMLKREADENVPLAVPSATAAKQVEIEQEITGADLANNIEAAIDGMDNLVLDEQELVGLKSTAATTAATSAATSAATTAAASPSIEEIASSLVRKPAVLASNKAARAADRLCSHVNSLISDMDGIINELHTQRAKLRQDIEVTEVHAKHADEEAARASLQAKIQDSKERMVGINDLLLSLRRIQKVPNDMRWERILQVLDEDKDGLVELDHVRRVVELLGSENVKLSDKDLERVMEMLEKESVIEKLAAAECRLCKEDSSSADASSKNERKEEAAL